MLSTMFVKTSWQTGFRSKSSAASSNSATDQVEMSASRTSVEAFSKASFSSWVSILPWCILVVTVVGHCQSLGQVSRISARRPHLGHCVFVHGATMMYWQPISSIVFHTYERFYSSCMLPGFRDSLSFGNLSIREHVLLRVHLLILCGQRMCGYKWRPSNSSSQGNRDKGLQKALSAEQFLAAAWPNVSGWVFEEMAPQLYPFQSSLRL